MKSIIQIVASIVLLTSNTSNAQTIPSQGSGNATSDFWSRSGNLQTTGANIFGTRWNSPIYTITGGISTSNVRMKVNGDFLFNTQYPIDNYNWGQQVNTSGYIGIGINNNSISNGQLFHNQKGAFSLLHLNGQGSGFQEYGYRPWMKTGVTFTGNRDLSYMGLRQVGTGEDITETTIAWADNNAGNTGPDDMVFRFLGAGTGSTAISSNLQSITDLDGLHIARFAPTGEFGLGNTFGVNAPGTPAGLYVRPQSLMHLSLDGNRQVWSQYTNQTTGQAQTDGLRMGIAPSGSFVNGYLRWQENTPFVIQSAYTVSGATATNGERMRITSIGALNNTEGNFGGLTTPTNRTRIAISADGANPITKPLSLLHLGYNTGAVAITPGTDGWRSWMDIGMFTTNGTDNVYLGLKDEGGLSGDRQDAVLSWGDNQVSGIPPGNGPDNFRMIFTSTTAPTGGGTAPATGVNGLEGMRMTPTATKGIYTGIGGDPTVNQYGPAGNSINPTATLEVNSWGVTSTPGGNSGLRFTNLQSTTPTIANPGTGVLSVDANGDVIYVTGGSGGIGNVCGGTPNPLTADTEIPLGGYMLNITENPLTPSSLLVGFPTCNNTVPSRFGVQNDIHTTAGYFESTTSTLPMILGIHANVTNTGGRAIGVDALVASTGSHTIALSGRAVDNSIQAPVHIGLDAHAANATSQSFAVNGDVKGSSSPFNYGYQTEINSGTNPSAVSYGVHSTITNNGATNYAGYFMATGAATNYGIFASALPGSGQQYPSGPNYAGFF